MIGRFLTQRGNRSMRSVELEMRCALALKSYFLLEAGAEQ